MSHLPPARRIAIFDFDGTLIRGDSLGPFLAAIAGPLRATAAFAAGLAGAMGGNALLDRRSAVKAALLHRTLAGRSLDEAEDAARRIGRRLRWRPAMVEALKAHKLAGCRIVVATGALDLYIEEALGDLPVDDVLATTMEVDGRRLTGRMAGGNCVRAEKARRVAAYLAEHGPFMESWGYGNRPSDLAMLALVDHPTVV